MELVAGADLVTYRRSVIVHVSITTELACSESEANKQCSINIDLADCVYLLLRVVQAAKGDAKMAVNHSCKNLDNGKRFICFNFFKGHNYASLRLIVVAFFVFVVVVEYFPFRKRGSLTESTLPKP